MVSDELPDWIEPRDQQLQAVEQICDAFERVPVVFFQGPTGTGKTIVAELVRRLAGSLTATSPDLVVSYAPWTGARLAALPTSSAG